MAMRVWIKQGAADEDRKCAVCGNRKSHGYVNASTRALLCTRCIADAMEQASLALDVVEQLTNEAQRHPTAPPHA